MEKKPLLYEAACIFSILGSSIGFASMFIASFFFKAVIHEITLITNITATEKLSPAYFALLGTMFCVSMIGVIKLYRMQRTGIYFYLAGQLVVLFLPVVWMGGNAFSTTNAIFILIFASVYLFYFRRLN